MEMGEQSEGTVLVVEDCDLQRRALVRFLNEQFGRVLEAETFLGASLCSEENTLACALVDLELPDGHGLDLVPLLKREHSDIRVVILTGHGSIASAVEALRRGADDYLLKPSSFEQVLSALRCCDSSVRSEFPTFNCIRKPRPLSIDRVKWEHIQRVLAEAGWNISEAARRLGVHRQSLQRTLRKPPTVHDVDRC